MLTFFVFGVWVCKINLMYVAIIVKKDIEQVMIKIMDIFSKLSLAMGIILLLPAIMMFFILQVYVFNPYWVVILVCVFLLIKSYKNNYFHFIKRIILYLLILCNVFAVYGFGVYCFGEYNFNLISQSICINLDVLFDDSKNSNLLLVKATAVAGLCFIEISYRLRLEVCNSSKN